MKLLIAITLLALVCSCGKTQPKTTEHPSIQDTLRQLEARGTPGPEKGYPVVIWDSPFHVGDAEMQGFKNPEPQGKELRCEFSVRSVSIGLRLGVWTAHLTPRRHGSFKRGYYHTKLIINGHDIAVLNEQVAGSKDSLEVTEIVVLVSPDVLHVGKNELVIEGGRRKKNIDDFEIHRIALLAPDAASAAKSDAGTSNGGDKESAVDVESEDERGQTPLFLAVLRKDPALVRRYIAQGADVNTTDNRGNSALHEAIHDAQLTGLLLDHGADVLVRDSDGNTALHDAFHSLHNGTLGSFALLLEKGGKKLADATNKEGITVLHMAGRYEENDDVLQAVRVTLEAGGAVNTKDKRGETPLHKAAKWGRIEVVKMLLTYGADLTVRSKYSYTPLGIAEAVFSPSDSLRKRIETTAEYLRSKGAE